MDDTAQSDDVIVTVVEVESLLPDEGEEIDDSDSDPDTKLYVVSIADTGVVTVTPNPVVSEEDIANCRTLTGGTGYSYDENSNLTNDGLYKYYYDCENSLTDVNNTSDRQVASHTYDYRGRRIKKVVYGSPDTTKYCYDCDQVIAEYEYDGSNNLLRKFIYGPGIDEPIYMIDIVDSNTVYYYHFDGLGSVL